MKPSQAGTRRSRRSGQGFTLLEVLLAMVLLAIGMTLAFSVLRSAQAVSARGEAISKRNEHMRSVEGFVRRRLMGALPIAHAARDGGRPVRFEGERERMVFVADLPAYLGHGGPYLHELQISSDGGGKQLQLGLSIPHDERTGQNVASRRTELLANDLKDIRFRYRGVDPQGKLSDWQSQWAWPERLPLQVELSIEPSGEKPWPPMVMLLAQSNSVVMP